MRERWTVVTAVLAAGSEKAAAHRLGLSHSTVKHHLASARSKVGAETTAQLVCADPGAAAVGARGRGAVRRGEVCSTALDPRLTQPAAGARNGDRRNQRAGSRVSRLMDARIRCFALLLLVAAFAVACSPAPTVAPSASPGLTPSPTLLPSSPSAAAVVTDAASGISFDRPASWRRWLPNAHDPINDGPLIYLSTDPLLPTCATTLEASPNPADSRGRACDWPLAELAPNGVLVTWLTTRILAPLPSTGDAVEVNGATGRLEIEKPGSCSEVGADETLDILVPIGQPKPWSNIAVVACLRGPDLAGAEAKVRAMLESARVSP